MSAMLRVLEPETLDHLAPDDPAAQRARRDLRRVNAFMGARRILERAMELAVPSIHREAPLRIVEIGCGDGRLLLDVATHRGERWPNATVDLLDRQPLITPDTIAAYAAAGWQAKPLVADVLDWAEDRGGHDGRRWDVVVANLFLHHFDGDALTGLLAGCAARADAVVACEPRRTAFALAASRLVFVLGANAVTRRDAVLSVRAGFVADELRRQWPAGAPMSNWALDEYDDGLFTHCFVAVRGGAGR